MTLEPENELHLNAAQGYAELGMWLDANTALEEIDADVRHVPAVLAVRLQIYRAPLEKWELMRTVAGKLAAYDPDDVQWIVSLAFSTRRSTVHRSRQADPAGSRGAQSRGGDSPLQSRVL